MQAIFLDDSDECTFDTVNLVVPVLLFKLAPLVVLTRNGSFATIETSAIEECSSS